MAADPVLLAVLALGAIEGMTQLQSESRDAGQRARYYTELADVQRKQSAVEESEARRENRRALGRQRALYAKSGVRPEGSPLLVQEETAALGEMDALAVRRAGDAVAARSLGEAARARARQRAAINSQFFQAGRTLLTGLGSPPSTYPVLS